MTLTGYGLNAGVFHRGVTFQHDPNEAADLVEHVEWKTREKAKHFLCQKDLKELVKKLMGSVLPPNADPCAATVIAVKQPRRRVNEKTTRQL